MRRPGGSATVRGMDRVRQLMTPKVLAAEPHVGLADLQADAIDYASHIGEFLTPDDVLDALSAMTSRHLPLCVLGAVRFPMMKTIEWSSYLQLGKTVFLHRDVPHGWWEEHIALAPGRFAPNLFLGRSSFASNTWTEIQHMFQPAGLRQDPGKHLSRPEEHHPAAADRARQAIAHSVFESELKRPSIDPNRLEHMLDLGPRIRRKTGPTQE